MGRTQKSAWFMLQRLRPALHSREAWLSVEARRTGDELEADETYVGRLENMHKDRKARLCRQGGFHGGKTAVQGILDREARQVRAQVVPDVKRETLQHAVLSNVKYGSTVYTDDAVS